MSYDANDLQDEFGDDLDDIAYEIAGLRRERDALAAQLEAARLENEQMRATIDCCPFDDTPLIHDDENPQLLWWCETCGHITERPSMLAALVEPQPEPEPIEDAGSGGVR